MVGEVRVFRRRIEIGGGIYKIVKKLRQKGALSHDKAMTAEEISTPTGFGERMKRHSGWLTACTIFKKSD